MMRPVFYLPAYFILIASVVTVTMSYIDIDMEKCSNCTGRADVPCIVQHMSHWCEYPMYSTSWPGAPRNLTAKPFKQNEKWFANFSWKPPYDSSLKSLEGFYLTVNVLEHEITGIGHPDCFFINMTQVDWAKVEDKYNVVFHFDCISSENQVTVFLMVTSSPAPSSNPQRLEIALQLPAGANHRKDRDVDIVERAKRQFTKGAGMPSNGPSWNVTINVRKMMVNGCPELQVRFEPPYPMANAHTILVYQVQSDEAQESVKLQSPESYTVFKNLPSNKEYFILIKPENVENSYLWRANGSVFIDECITPDPTKNPTPAVRDYIAIIIVFCILLVTIVTVCTFCLIRRGHNDTDFFSQCVICKTRPPVSYAAANIGESPNIMIDFESEMRRTLYVLHSNHPEIKQACQAVCRLLQKTNTVDVLTTEQLLSKTDLLNASHLQDIPILILDDIIMQLWKDDYNKSFHDSSTGPLANIIQIVKKTYCVDDILFVSLLSKEQRCWKSLIPGIGKKLYYFSSKRNDEEYDFMVELNLSAINRFLAQLPGCKKECIWNTTEEARMLESSLQSLVSNCQYNIGVKCEHSMLGLEPASAMDGNIYCSRSSSLSSPSTKSSKIPMVHPNNECSLHCPTDSGHGFHGNQSTEKWVEQQTSRSFNFRTDRSELYSTSACTACQANPLLGSCAQNNRSYTYVGEDNITQRSHFPRIEGYSNSLMPCPSDQTVNGNVSLHSMYHLDICNTMSNQTNPDVMAEVYNSCGHVIHPDVIGFPAVRYENRNNVHRCRMHPIHNYNCDQLEEFIGPESDEESTTDSVVYKRLMDLNKRNGFLPQQEEI